MPGRDDVLCRERLAWLLVIGQRLKLEYDALARPLPPALATLLEQLEARAKHEAEERATNPSEDEAAYATGARPTSSERYPRKSDEYHERKHDNDSPARERIEGRMVLCRTSLAHGRGGH
jgi:predicted RNA-binding protein